MGVDFTTIYPADGGEPWEAACDHCGEPVDLDHYADMQAHDDLHCAEEQAARELEAKGGPRHRA